MGQNNGIVIDTPKYFDFYNSFCHFTAKSWLANIKWLKEPEYLADTTA